MATKLALIIANSEYQDQRLAPLSMVSQDAAMLAEVLSTPDICGFDEVLTLVNETEATLRRAINRHFAGKQREDLLLLYFSGHGVLDEQGLLYFAGRDTELAALRATSVPAHFIRQEMDLCYSRRQVLILDCCYSGAFLRAKSASGHSVGTANAFDVKGYGRVVMTASDATQFAWEHNQLTGGVPGSVFTSILVHGLKSGEADLLSFA